MGTRSQIHNIQHVKDIRGGLFFNSIIPTFLKKIEANGMLYLQYYVFFFTLNRTIQHLKPTITVNNYAKS